MRGFREKAGPALLAMVAASLLALPTASLAKKKNSEPETQPAAQAPAQAAPQAAAPGKAGAPAPSGAVAMIGDTPITDTELTEQAANQLQRLKSQEYDIKRRVLEDLITKKLIEKEAAARGISVDELNKAEIEAKAPAVTDEEKKTVYEANKARFGDKPEADVMKTMIEPSLKQQRINQRRTEFLSELRAKAQVKVLLEPPRIAVDVGNAAVKGPKDAPVTIVEFSDYQ